VIPADSLYYDTDCLDLLEKMGT